MRKIILTALCTLVAITSFGKKRDDIKSIFYEEGYVLDLDVHFNSNSVGIAQFFNASVGYGYKLGNGFDTSFIVGFDMYPPTGGDTVSSYVRCRYHFFDKKMSPFVSLDAGMEYFIGSTDFVPSLRGAIGMTYGRFSVAFSFGAMWIDVPVEECISTRIGAMSSRLGFSYSF